MTRATRGDDSQPFRGSVTAAGSAVHTSEAVTGSSVVSASGSLPLAGVRVDGVWDVVFCDANMARAVRQVVAHRGAPGVDSVTVDQLDGWLVSGWPQVRSQLEDGTFRPSLLRRVEIPKPGAQRRVGFPRNRGGLLIAGRASDSLAS